MEVTLLIISKHNAEILNECPLYLNFEGNVVKEIYDKIYDLYPTLKLEDYKLYWRYNKDTFFNIYDYFSYVCALTVMVDKIVMLVLEDSVPYYLYNELFQNNSRIKGMVSDWSLSQFCINCTCSEGSVRSLIKTNSEILTEAFNTKTEPLIYTEDLRTKIHIMECMKKGWPKEKETLVLLRDENLERVLEQEPGSKKDKDKGKGKGKDKSKGKGKKHDKSKSSTKSKSKK